MTGRSELKTVVLAASALSVFASGCDTPEGHWSVAARPIASADTTSHSTATTLLPQVIMRAPAAETDAPPQLHLLGGDLPPAVALAHDDDARPSKVAVTESGDLVDIDAPAISIADRVVGRPVPLGDRWIVRRAGDLPGETNLWLVSPENATRLTEAAGGDDLPVVLDKRTIAFVSTRSSVASWWRLDVRSGALAQLTNRGLVAGDPRGWQRFVPTPANLDAIERDGDLIRYPDESGERWTLHPRTGEVRR